MSKLIATNNFNTGKWLLQVESLSAYHVDLHIGFVNQVNIVEFKDLKFGYELRQDENIKQYGVYPPAGVRYVKSDQPHLTIERLHLQTEQTYTLFLWAENDGQRFEKEFEFTAPRPEQPYPSWTWNGERWNAPVPYPDDGNYYQWDEDNIQWVEMSV